MIITIDTFVLHAACTQAKQWPGIRVAVNLSPVHFRHRDLVNTVRDVLQETGLEPSRLELEVTESVLINDTETALENLTALKALGVAIAMDDFGTGYSSLGYLNAFPFDKIKIDRSFIATISDGDKSSAIVRSVISLGDSLAMVTTAEGVETEEQLNFLISGGCKQVQGYYISPAVPAAELSTLLMNWSGPQADTADAAAA